MIVRILGEGRFDVPEADMPAIEQLDAQLTDALDRDDEAAFDSTLADLVGQVRHTWNPASGRRPPDVRSGRPSSGVVTGRGPGPPGRRFLTEPGDADAVRHGAVLNQTALL